MTTRREFALGVRKEFADEFDLLAACIRLVERVIDTPRQHSSLVRLALDLLMVQAYKCSISAFEVALLGHVEDAATMARRLLELGAQAGVIEKGGEDIAGAFLANLWDDIELDAKKRLPEHLVHQWNDLLGEHVAKLNPKRRMWGLNFRDMFASIGAHPDLYEKDYKLLSSIAHGSNDNLLLTFSELHVQIRERSQIGTVVRFCPNYLLVTVTAWNNTFEVIPNDELAPLILQAADLEHEPEALMAKKEHHFEHGGKAYDGRVWSGGVASVAAGGGAQPKNAMWHVTVDGSEYRTVGARYDDFVTPENTARLEAAIVADIARQIGGAGDSGHSSRL